MVRRRLQYDRAHTVVATFAIRVRRALRCVIVGSDRNGLNFVARSSKNDTEIVVLIRYKTWGLDFVSSRQDDFLPQPIKKGSVLGGLDFRLAVLTTTINITPSTR